MRLRQRFTTSAIGRRLPRRTVRLRLTMLYGSLFLASGAVLLVITAVLWGSATTDRISVSGNAFVRILTGLAPRRAAAVTVNAYPQGQVRLPARSGFALPGGGPHPIWQVTSASLKQRKLVAGQLDGVVTAQHTSDLHQLLLYSGLALAIMAMLAVVLGWLMAGRVLRPVRTITTAARDISVTNLHERLRLDGPDDELKELGDTFDGLLERLEGSFEAQRQFVANASHELRTPLATMRAMLDVAVAKPGPVPEETVNLADRLRGELDQVDQLLESFLALARAQRGPMVDEATLSLDDLATTAIDGRARAVAALELEVDHERGPDAPVTGSETLLARMVENVVDNAVKHNEHGGWVRVRTDVYGALVRLVVENGGPVLDEASVAELARPFRRIGADRTGSDRGTGLGLSIVAAVAEAHGGKLELRALPDGGFQVVIELPLTVRAFAELPA